MASIPLGAIGAPAPAPGADPKLGADPPTPPGTWTAKMF